MLSLNKPKKRYIAAEMIDMQDRSFGKNIEVIVSKIFNKIKSDTDFKKETKELETLIYKRLGLQVKLQTNTPYVAAILPFYVNKNHIFMNMFLRGNVSIEEQDSILKEASGKKGYVDLKRSKVHGIFSEYINPLYINFAVMLKQYHLSVSEVTSTILHELGHGFYVCEYADRIETTNQVLANVAKEMLSGKKEKNIDYIYKELKSLDETVDQKTIDDIVSGKNVIAGYHLFKIALHSIQSQMKVAKYDETAFENLADNFASRFGYGRELVVALEKLHDYFINPEKGLVWNTTSFVLSTLYCSVITAMVIGIIQVGAVTSLYFGIFLSISFLLSGEAAKDYTYDDLKIRYKRIRQEQIALIKNLDIPKSDLEDLLENIYFIDSVIDNTYEYRGIMSRLANLILPFNRKTVDSLRDQQLLEDLAFNQLYVNAAEIRLHS